MLSTQWIRVSSRSKRRVRRALYPVPNYCPAELAPTDFLRGYLPNEPFEAILSCDSLNSFSYCVPDAYTFTSVFGIRKALLII